MEELLTVAEVAEQLDRPPVTIRYWIRTGQLDAVRLPKRGKYPRYRIRKAVVEEIKQREHQVQRYFEDYKSIL